MQLSSSPDSYIMDFLGHPDYFRNVTARTLFGLTDPGIMPIFQSNALLLMEMPKASRIWNYVLNMPQGSKQLSWPFLD